MHPVNLHVCCYDHRAIALTQYCMAVCTVVSLIWLCDYAVRWIKVYDLSLLLFLQTKALGTVSLALEVACPLLPPLPLHSLQCHRWKRGQEEELAFKMAALAWLLFLRCLQLCSSGHIKTASMSTPYHDLKCAQHLRTLLSCSVFVSTAQTKSISHCMYLRQPLSHQIWCIYTDESLVTASMAR